MRTTFAATFAAALAALTALAADAQAEPHRRVVVLRFDGPTALADEARELVIDAAGRDNDVVALGRWADAHKAASKKLRGARAWAKSAREAQVDAIIEGSVHRGRRGYALELVVREAATGNQVDSVELQVDDDRRAERAIEGELTDLLAWVEPPAERADLMRLDRELDRDDDRRDRDEDRYRDRDDRRDSRDDDRRADRRDSRDDRRDSRDDDRRADRRDSRDDDRRADRRDSRDDDRRADRRDSRDDRRDSRDDDRRADRRDSRDDRRDSRDDDGRADRSRDRDDDRRDRDRDDDRRASRDDRDSRDDDRWSDRDDRDDRDDDRDDRDSRDADEGFGFAADDDRDDRARDLDLADETVLLLDGERPAGSRKAAPGARKTMLRVAGGGYVTSRSLGLIAPEGGLAPGGDSGHPTVGLHLRAEVFPFGEVDAGRRLTGLGLRVELARALGNKVSAQVDGAPAQLGVDQTAWSAALAYRRPLEPVTLQLDLGYGSTSQAIADKPMTVEVVDAAYSYVRGGGRVELPVAGRATVGAGVHYLYLTGAPEMQKLGAPSARGFDADASVEVPLTTSLTALGGLEYQRISLTFGPGGSAAAATDSFLSARLALGVSY